MRYTHKGCPLLPWQDQCRKLLLQRAVTHPGACCLYQLLALMMQPFEEAAYLAFSQPADGKLSQREAAAKRLRVLSIAVRSATLIGAHICSLLGCAAAQYI